MCGCASPGDADPYLCYCGVDDLMRILRRRYSLAVLNVVRSHGSVRFHDIEAAIRAASTSTLAETLRALTTAQLIVRDGKPDSIPRAIYRITPSGEELLQRLHRLLEDVSHDD